MLVKYELIPGVYCVHNTGRLYSRPVIPSSCLQVAYEADLCSGSLSRTSHQAFLCFVHCREFCSSSTPFAMKVFGEALYMLNLAFLFCSTEAAKHI